MATLLMDVGYDKIVTLATGSPMAPQSTVALFLKSKDSAPLLTFVLLAIVLPVAEEIIFRGYLFDALRKRFSATAVIITTALIFALIHFQVTQFPALFGMGLVFGWAKSKSGTLRLPALLHAFNVAASVRPARIESIPALILPATSFRHT